MYGVLIVDDENLIVSLIENLIEWPKYNMEVVGTADNGYMALKQVDVLRPDIVIVDVRMPGYDGISFMKKVREINSRIKFIVISGHKKFEYAKSAMKYNVEDYLIKPISKEELEQILEKLYNKLEDEKRTEQIEEKRNSDFTTSQIKLHRYFMDFLLEEPENIAQLEENNVNQTYFTHFSNGIYRNIIIKIDSQSTRPDEKFMETLLYGMSQQFIESVKDGCYDVAVRPCDDCIYAVCNYGENREKEVEECIKEYFKNVDEKLRKFGEIVLTIGEGEKVNSLNMLERSIKSSENCIKARVVHGIHKMISFEEVLQDEGVIAVVLSDEARDKWEQAIKGFGMEQIKMQIFSIFSTADAYSEKDNLIFGRTLEALYRNFYDYIRKIDLYKQPYKEFRKELDETVRWDYTGRMMADDLERQINKYISEYAGDNGQQNNPAIRIVKKYIAENYQKNISMTGMAELVNLSSVYFSMLFKREVGINFLDYLNKYRLEVSKQLLRQVKYNINEVAELSGFQDAKYFSKLFKKTFGITPTEYRRRNAG